MTKTLTVLGLLTGFSLATVSTTYAQAPAPATEKLFINVNAGVQLSDRSITTIASIPIYDENAIVTATQPVSGSAIFDISAGYRVWGDFYVALAVTTYSDTAAADYTASIPHPLFTDRPVIVSGRVDDLKRTEIGFHPQLLWTRPLTDRMDLALAAGPSFFRVSLDAVDQLTLVEGTQNGTASAGTEKGTAKGFNVGADVTYTLTPRYGIGGFIRYAKGSVDLPAISDLKVGGVQIGAGIRVRLF
jgi:hypothetical protein